MIMVQLGKLLVVSACIAYPFLLHLFILKGEEVDGLQLLLVLLPLLVWGGWIAARSIPRLWWSLLAAGMLALVYYMLASQHMRIGLIAVDGIWHASLNLFFLWFFGRTLRKGQEPLISQISRRLNDGLDARVAAYTRQVTVAWTIFFGMQLSGSALLYLFAPISAWSLFINVLNMPLLALMFMAEHLVRIMLHPDHARIPILKTIEVFTKDFAVPKKTGCR
jgi:uncharacterized membrane protein